jgi:hypothetical protein
MICDVPSRGCWALVGRATLKVNAATTLRLTRTRIILQRYLARIAPSDRQTKGHLAAKLSDCTPASRSLARPQETSNVVVIRARIKLIFLARVAPSQDIWVDMGCYPYVAAYSNTANFLISLLGLTLAPVGPSTTSIAPAWLDSYPCRARHHSSRRPRRHGEAGAR